MDILPDPEARAHIITRIAGGFGLIVATVWVALVISLIVRGRLGEGAMSLFLSMPMIAWIANFSFRVVFFGRLSGNSCWPFASCRVLVTYMFLMPLAMRLLFQKS